MPGNLHAHVVSPPQTLPGTVTAEATELASATDQSLEASVEEDQTVEELVTQTRRQQKRYHRVRNRLLLFGATGLFLAVSPLLLWPAHVTTLVGLMLLNVVLLCGGLLVYRCLRQWTDQASKLENLHDVRAVRPLVEMFSGLEPRSQQTARLALIELLPRLQRDDAALLDADQRRLLRRFLGGIPLRRGQKEHSDLVIAILKSYEQIGDRTDLPIVERLAQGKGWASDPAVQAAAAACLPLLQQSVDNERDPQTLLRASKDTAAPAEILLRPAQGATHADAELLLRAAPGDVATESADERQGPVES